MKKNLLGRVFCSSSGQPYAYITQTNQIVRVDRVWYESLCDTPEREQAVLADLLESGLFTDELPEELTFPCSMEEYREQAAGMLRSLTLEISQQCTLRCSYCIYSGNYAQARTHQDREMSRETAHRSIDLFAARNTGWPDAVISFYGGEALLAFETVKDAVAYARERICGKPLTFRISTNGTTITPDVIAWLEENPDVSLTVTVNGYAHDSYRRFPGGGGSLEKIMQTMQKIRREHPSLWPRVEFIANAVNARELLDIRRFYMEHIGKPPLLITGITSYGGSSYIESLIARESEEPAAAAEAKRLYLEENDPYLAGYYQLNLDDVLLRPMEKRLGRVVHGECCMPFGSSMFVAADGTLGLCEKAEPDCRFGTAETGIDMAFCEELLDRTRALINDRCRFCWAEPMCDVCYQSMDIRGEELKIGKNVCERTQSGITEMLQMFTDLAEKDPRRVLQMKQEAAERAKRCR